jgi:hypothetical protein
MLGFVAYLHYYSLSLSLFNVHHLFLILCFYAVQLIFDIRHGACDIMFGFHIADFRLCDICVLIPTIQIFNIRMVGAVLQYFCFLIT